MKQEHFIQAAGHRLRALQLGNIQAGSPTLVFLHGGIDTIEMWRDFPEQVHQSTGLSVIVYDRWGHGQSEPLTEFRECDTRAEEADEPLLDIFKHFGLTNVILVGHSYGGVISLIAASLHTGIIRGVVSIVPQMLIHPLCLAGVEDAKEGFENGNLQEKLQKFHGEGLDTLFYDWINRVNSSSYQAEDCSQYLQKITCPILQIYGKEDVYGYLPNLELSEKHIPSKLSINVVPDAGHYVHLEAKETVVNAVKEFCLTL
ncbi:MAG: alpha/beta hydrolase [Methylophilaceae bacterium]|jgi:pimeloyl-ACP methyl ester carboxylesterase|nr:alpha/beta hydrolase [Cycloclasticus sp.]HIL92206.1 alpha/beta hydrolase [Cycloclasticus sp.]